MVILNYELCKFINNYFIAGTTQKGRTDEWYGETGRDTNVQQYDVESVLNSKAGVAITGFITKMQVLEKKLIRLSENNSTEKGLYL